MLSAYNQCYWFRLSLKIVLHSLHYVIFDYKMECSEFLKKFLTNNFALSDTEDNTSRLLNRGGIADLPLLRTLLAIYEFNSFENLFCNNY